MNNDLETLKQSGEAPQWMDEFGYLTLCGGYLLPNETPKAMYKRVAQTAAKYCNNAQYEQRFFDILWNNWLCLASPVASNFGTDRGLPISCNSIHVSDSIDGIFKKSHELAVLSKNGAGVGIYIGDVRGRGAPIKGNGTSEGVIPWAKLYDTVTMSVNQGATRRGASAVYLPVEHADIEEFLNIRRPTGDMNRRCLNINHGVCITNSWMISMKAGNKPKRAIWENILKSRVETGEPYLFFTDNVNDANPECYKANGLSVKTSNICCLAGDTLVLTKTGPTRIDLLENKTVTIWDGRDWVENSSFSKRGHGALTRVHIKDGSYIDCTDNHRWFVSNNYVDIAKGKTHEILTKDLKTETWIEYHKQEFHGTIREAGGYLKGFLLGDGTSTKKKEIPHLNLHFPKFCCQDKLITSALEIAPEQDRRSDCLSTPEFSDIIDNTGKYEGVYGRQIFKNMKGLTARANEVFKWSSAHKEQLPEKMLLWDRASKLEFLSGVFDADGTYSKGNGIQISSKFLQPIQMLQMVIKTFGFASGIDKSTTLDDNGDLRGVSYRLSVGSLDSYEFMQLLDCKRLKNPEKAPNRRCSGWRQIVKIENLSGEHAVYCTTVATTGKFALANGLMTGNSEITLFTDPDHSFVCCLSSLNLARWDEWKDTDTVYLAVRFLDAVLEEYIQKTANMTGFEAAHRSAVKGRAIGLGVLGWHSLLQQKHLPFDHFDSMALNALIFRTIKTKAEEATKVLAIELGEPLWCQGFGRRNTHLMACAPTVSNSTISGGYSAGIEPISANVYSQKSAKGTFIRKNNLLIALLESKKLNTPEIWKTINENAGSITHLKELTAEEKQVFLTAREINQHAIVKQAAQRQQFIDQGQSVNLFFASNSNPKYIHEVHLAAWELGLKTLYYCRSEGVIRGDLASRSKEECEACSG